jgi:hypothetical protein
MSDSLRNKGDSPIASGAENASGMQTGDCDGCSSGHGSDKQNDKQNDKRVSTDPDLQRVVDIWPDLPEPIKTGIPAIVRTIRQNPIQ